MGKLGENTKCRECGGQMTLTLEREQNGDPKWKGWICDNSECGFRTEESFPHPEGIYGQEVFPPRVKKD